MASPLNSILNEKDYPVLFALFVTGKATYVVMMMAELEKLYEAGRQAGLHGV